MKMIAGFLTALLAMASAAVAQQPAAPFQVFPGAVDLTTSRDTQTLVVQVVQPDGVTRDVTAEAQIAISDPKLAKVEANVVKPLADGAGTVNVTHGGHTVSLPLKVAQAATERPISFKLDVMPVFLKAGCYRG